MAILQITQSSTGLEGVLPRIVHILSTDSFATITAAGWLSGAQREGLYAPLPSDMLLVAYLDGSGNVISQYFTITISNGIVTINPTGGDIVVPTIANHIIVSTDTMGTLGNLTGTAINNGDIQAGISGTPGRFISLPATAANGSLILAAVNAGGAFNTTISNTTMGQSTVYTIPNVVNAAGRFLVGATATPFVSGNFPVASGTGGLMVDSGLAAANIQNRTNILAARTANIGGGGAGPISVVVAGLTAASIVTGSIQASTNTVSVSKITATATGFDILFSADPGATCTVNYVAFIAAQ